jgi:hypothetical protein
MSLGIDVPNTVKVVIEDRSDVILLALSIDVRGEERLQFLDDCAHVSGFCIVLKIVSRKDAKSRKNEFLSLLGQYA